MRRPISDMLFRILSQILKSSIAVIKIFTIFAYHNRYALLNNEPSLQVRGHHVPYTPASWDFMSVVVDRFERVGDDFNPIVGRGDRGRLFFYHSSRADITTILSFVSFVTVALPTR